MTRERLAEQLLLLRCQAGDDAAFADLYRRFGPKTARYLRGVLDGAWVEDAQQEVWLTVYRRVSTLADPGGFRTWLFQVTRSRAVDALRRVRREREMLDVLGGEGGDHDDPEDDRLDVDEEAIARAVEGLSTPHREVLLLRYWEDLAYAEIALVTGVPIGTVRSRLSHAKRQVRNALESARRSPTLDAAQRGE